MNRNVARNGNGQASVGRHDKAGLRQLKGKIKEQWTRLTDEEIDELVGRNERLAGKLRERYGWALGEARRQVDEFYRRHLRLH